MNIIHEDWLLTISLKMSVRVRVNFTLMTDICRGHREIWILDINMDINVNIIALTDPHQTFAQYIGPE